MTRTWNAAFLCGPVRQARFLRGCACIMLPWIGVLIDQARGPRGGHLFPRGIAVAWVGLDLLEVAGLLATAWFLRRRRIETSPLAMATATLFLVDALFDNSTATGGLSYLISTVSTLLLELPMATLLAWISWRALRPGSPEPLIIGFDVAVTDEHDTITAVFEFLGKMPGRGRCPVTAQRHGTGGGRRRPPAACMGRTQPLGGDEPAPRSTHGPMTRARLIRSVNRVSQPTPERGTMSVPLSSVMPGPANETAPGRRPQVRLPTPERIAGYMVTGALIARGIVLPRLEIELAGRS